MLDVRDLVSGYGGGKVLNGASLSVSKGEVVAVMGRNGVGKTTFLKTLMGIISAQTGTVKFEANSLTGLPTHRISQSGLGYVPQGRGIFDKLTVEENLQMGLRAQPDLKRKIPEFIYERFPILFERRTQLAGTLSGGQKQQLAISRALCGDPKILLLDEPSEGIQPNIVQDIGTFIRELAESQGTATLLVEQNLELISIASDRFEIMEKGIFVHRGARSELQDEAMLKKYLAV